MSRGFYIFCAALLALVMLFCGLMLSVTRWLPRLAGIWLPPDTTIVLAGNPHWRNGGLWLSGLNYQAGDCVLASVSGVTLRWRHPRWQVSADSLSLNIPCLNKLPPAEKPDAPRSLAAWQKMLPAADIVISQLEIAPYQAYAGKLQLSLDSTQQQLYFQGNNLQLSARLQGQQLQLQQLRLSHPALTKPVILAGQLTLPVIPAGLPLDGKLHGDLSLPGMPQPLTVLLNWQQQQGELVISPPDEAAPLLSLPWNITPQQIEIRQGAWRWPYAMQPVSGGISLTLSGWQQGLAATEIRARLNLLTSGRGGKGNVVLSMGPGHLDMLNSQLPFQLTGSSKLQALQFYSRMAGMINGSLLDPQLVLQPGALLRMRGRLLSTLEVDEARWPLAGVKLSSAGIDGRLQAILQAHDPNMGRFTLHLDGRASQFWPDSGRWDWRYWGKGYMAPLAAKWDAAGTGNWRDSTIELNTLSTGFDHLSYGMVNVQSPRLTLNAPVRWQRSAQHPAFDGELQLAARETTFTSGGYLPSSTLNLRVKGRDPADFLFNGALQAEAIGPLRVNGRWDGQRLRGQAWWPEQSLMVFQPLLSREMKMNIQSGTLRAQVAFSAAARQGLAAGGHWAVNNGSVRMPDNEINGVDFSLPFRLKAHQWYFGARGPVSLRIKAVKNQFALSNITADLQGSYPYSDRQPLRLSNVSVDLLGGKLSMAELSLPQHQAATVRLHEIGLSELVTAIKPKQIAMSGHINGALPLWLNHPQWLIQQGWIANSGSLTLRLDQQMADAIASNNMAASVALDWLRYMEISRSWATINLDNLGELTMSAQVAGSSRFRDKTQRVTLNYTHRENLFQLWRSLRFGDNLQSWVEQNATLPSQKEKKSHDTDN
ncbi:YdbH family protein [Pantoea sp. B65]|uniref:YdbH family protein n=1 Tax=Pantoea sp. B65 TaxID=2813359 RepID=UPI0039B45D72